MAIRPGVRGPVRGLWHEPIRRSALLAVPVALLVFAAGGCGARRQESKETATHRAPDSTSTAGSSAQRTTKSAARTKSATGADEKATAQRENGPAGATNHVRLRPHGCVQFEPHWTTIHVGQSLTWHSDLKTSVTIHVPVGAFDRTEYVVRAGQNVSTGPARARGTYPMWSDPAACQGIARGVQGSGPGVTVSEAAR